MNYIRLIKYSGEEYHSMLTKKELSIIVPEIVRYMNDTGDNLFYIIKELSNIVFLRKDKNKKFFNNKGQLFIEIRPFNNELLHELNISGYSCKYSEVKKSRTIYVLNDNGEKIRFSDHEINDTVNNHGIEMKRFHKQIVSRDCIFNSEEIKEAGFNIRSDEGFYYLSS